MTEETGQKIVQILESTNIASAIGLCLFVIVLLVEAIYFIYKYKKVKAMLEKYYLTLNEEQKEAIKKYQEIKKL